MFGVTVKIDSVATQTTEQAIEMDNNLWTEGNLK